MIEKKYIVTNEKLIEDLGIHQQEQRALKTIIGYGVKRDRTRARKNKEYKPIKETNQSARAQRNALIVEMKQDNPSITQKEIAEVLGVNQATVSRVLNKANL